MAVGRSMLLTLAKSAFAWLEKGILAVGGSDGASRFPPVFIIGAPRSGTTLLYQVLVARYTFAYFSNFIAQFHRAPILAAWLQEMTRSRSEPLGDYSSDRGRTEGRSGPHEAGAFWYRWFPKGDQVYVPPGVTPKAHLAELRQEVAGMSSVFKASMVFKNVYNTMRVAPITEAFPEACFLVCHRDPTDTAQSILKERMRTHGDKEPWWSVPPREIAAIRRHPYWEQVVEQVYYTYQQVSRDTQAFGAARFHHLRYEEFCGDVYAALADIGRFLERRKVKAHVRGDVPSRFAVSSTPKVETADSDRIAQKVRQLWS